jgi:hypothetical protein
MTREELLDRLSNVENLLRQRPWWQQNLLAELSKTMSDQPRSVQAASPDHESSKGTSSTESPQSDRPVQFKNQYQ